MTAPDAAGELPRWRAHQRERPLTAAAVDLVALGPVVGRAERRAPAPR